MRNGRGGGELSKHSPCCMGNEYKEPLSHESRNSGRQNWNAGKFIIWISKQKKKSSLTNNFWLIPGKELIGRFRLMAFLPQETLLWFTYDNNDTAVLARRWGSHLLYCRVIRRLMHFPQNFHLWHMKTFLSLRIKQFFIEGIPQCSHAQRTTTKQKKEMYHVISCASPHSKRSQGSVSTFAAQCQCLVRKAQCRQPKQQGEDTAWDFCITRWNGLGSWNVRSTGKWGVSLRDPVPFVLKSAWFISSSCLLLCNDSTSNMVQ